jgi:hypothetical protein
MLRDLLFLISILFFAISANAQSYTQTIRGTIVDKQSQMALTGANVVVLNSNPFKGCVSDEQGKFRLENIEVGRQQIKVSYLGYKEQVIPVLLTSAKEFIVHIQLEEAIIQGKEVVITGEADKSRALNEMSAVSTRSFQIDEANRYAGSRNDPARMASNYAGVVGGSDNRNDIIIRGNSPLGLLWRMENVDIPNPNHFAATGATGGAISILNNNVLANSDFMTGAFAAEYINALSGVFDLKIRNGNNEKREYTGQVGLNGFELGAEGPFNSKKQSSYLASYRYSAPAIMQRMGINLGTSGIPFYQDMTYKLHFPLKKGSLSVFGVGGVSRIEIKESNKNGDEMYAPENRDIYFGSAMAVSGATYTRFLNNTTYAKISLAGTFEQNNNKVDSLDKDRIPGRIWLDLSNRYKGTVHALINKKYSSRLTVRSGIMSDYMSFGIENKRYYPNDSVRTILNSDGYTFLNRAYTQAAYKVTSRLILNTGISFIHLALNNNFSIEPRAALSYEFSGAQRLSIGYGKHSRMHDIMVYFIETNVNGVQTLTNKNLDFTKAHHFVAGYDWSITENIRIKAEAYYQTLYKIPVEERASYFSLANAGADFTFPRADSLVNNGTGENYGIEFTLERFFNKGYYYLFTTSLFESKYKGSDGIKRNTAFNVNYIGNFLFGKEFKTSANSVLSADLRITRVGGRRYVPIDVIQSRLYGFAWYDTQNAFEPKLPDYFRIDVKIGFRINGKKISQEIAASVENITNNKNVLEYRWDETNQNTRTTYQLGFFPIGIYRIYF